MSIVTAEARTLDQLMDRLLNLYDLQPDISRQNKLFSFISIYLAENYAASGTDPVLEELCLP